MDPAFMVSLFLVWFCHWMELAVGPANNACLGSTIFIVICLMAIHKSKVRRGFVHESNMDKIIETVILFFLMQVLLIVVWYVASQAVQYLVDGLCDAVDAQHWTIDLLRSSLAPNCLLAIELWGFINYFNMEDIQHFFGTEEDRVLGAMLAYISYRKSSTRIGRRTRGRNVR